MNIATADLKIILHRLISEIETYLGDEINISDELYWDLSEDDLFNINHDAVFDQILGDLNEDWIELSRIRNENEEAISYDLRRLSLILLAIRKESRGIW